MLGYALLLILAAVALGFLEMIFPSGGLLGIFSVACLIAGITLGFMVDGATGLILLAVSTVVGPMVMFYGFKLLPKTTVGKKIVLSPHVESPSDRGRDGVSEESYDHLKGRQGKALCDLRPSGYVEIGGKRFQVTADCDLIETGASVIVTAVEGNSIMVDRNTKDRLV